MIQVTRLDNREYHINALYIEKIESLPDTTITLTNGKKHFVKEPVSEVIDKVNDFYKSIGVIQLAKKEVKNDE